MSRRSNHRLERLRAYEVDVDETVARRHLDAIHAALAEAPDPAAVPLAVASSPRRRLRQRAAAALAGLVLAGAPVGAAVAAEGTVPGDLLYPVKQVTERLRSVVDHDIVAQHRIDEFETLLDRGADEATLARQMTRARLALDDLGDNEELQLRFQHAVGRMERHGEDAGNRPDGAGDTDAPRSGQDPADAPPGTGPGVTSTSHAGHDGDGGGSGGPANDPAGPSRSGSPGTMGPGDGSGGGDGATGTLDQSQDQVQDRDGTPSTVDPAAGEPDPPGDMNGDGEPKGAGDPGLNDPPAGERAGEAAPAFEAPASRFTA
jgi:hypothetical protein